ncbi:hypothetical protein CGC20_15340 [Leishmania donovani]|uniref:Uncharacterized protein n=1 Tax=Leishmania donovani TaxID=5661 RepID=A0A504XIB1_LEIDO|nr:hypothetical protein CGC20_15340 [Leishmania donovani]
MELGKLVTTESRGCIYYFIIDDVHPDEPQHDALKHYYVVTATSSSFSYREAYGVLCRALCSLDNRTFLHRWHSLYEQIFGTTPYVQFMDAVRNSPLVCLDTFAPQDEGGSNNGNGHATAARPLSVACAPGPGSSGSSSSSTCPSGTVALFSNEATARLALRRILDAEQQQPHCSPNASGARSPHHQHGCCTPIHAQPASINGDANHGLPAPHQPMLNGGTAGIGCANQVEDPAGPAAISNRTEPQQEVNGLLDLASRWRLDACCSATDAKEQHGALEELQQQVHALQRKLSEERTRHSKQLEELLSQNEQLKKRLGQQHREQSARIEKFLKDNEDAVTRMEGALHKREEEVRAVYTQALQERDVRIAQLSQEVLQHTHEARQLAAVRSDEERLHVQRAAHLEDMAAQVREWNLSLQRQLADANDEVRRLRQRLEVMDAASVNDAKGCALVSGAAGSDLAGFSFPYGMLPRAQAVQLATQLYHSQQLLQECRQENETKSNELMRAAQLIDALKEGLRRVKVDLGAGSTAAAPATAMPSS